MKHPTYWHLKWKRYTGVSMDLKYTQLSDGEELGVADLHAGLLALRESGAVSDVVLEREECALVRQTHVEE